MKKLIHHRSASHEFLAGAGVTGVPPVWYDRKRARRPFALVVATLILMLSFAVARAHDHIEVGKDPSDEARLFLDGPDYQLALYVPRGEPFSGYLPQFPGGWHACELTFTTETNALEPADGADPRIEIVSVQGPAGGAFAFWEVDATAPTWSRPTGWSGSGNVFPVILAGDTHAHGRAFTMDKPGTYTVVFRVVDAANKFAASASKTITFVAQQPPQLSLRVVGGNVSLSFTSRANLVYDLQVCTDLESGGWTNVELHTFIDGYGDVKNMSDPMVGRPRAFYRLVEYY
jgi:hypothetical protein